MVEPLSTVTSQQVLHGLLLRCARRDEAAFAEYYRRTSPFLKAWLQCRGPQSRDVANLLVAAYTEVWRQAPDRYDGARSAWSWTLEVADQAVQRLSGPAPHRPSS